MVSSQVPRSFTRAKKRGQRLLRRPQITLERFALWWTMPERSECVAHPEVEARGGLIGARHCAIECGCGTASVLDVTVGAI